MTQIEKAPPDRVNGPNLSEEQRRRLRAWVEEDGWCSACARGLRWGDGCRVVHLGKKDTADFAVCMSCLAKMNKAAGSPSEGPEHGK